MLSENNLAKQRKCIFSSSGRIFVNMILFIYSELRQEPDKRDKPGQKEVERQQAQLEINSQAISAQQVKCLKHIVLGPLKNSTYKSKDPMGPRNSEHLSG